MALERATGTRGDGKRVSGATGADAAEAFALLLRELKDRSGLSYGALAKRLHMSTSTLHRYCNGTAVPVDYAPVERLARLCRATQQELVELHRRWILADATRGSRTDQPPPRQPATERTTESENNEPAGLTGLVDLTAPAGLTGSVAPGGPAVAGGPGVAVGPAVPMGSGVLGGPVASGGAGVAGGPVGLGGAGGSVGPMVPVAPGGPAVPGGSAVPGGAVGAGGPGGVVVSAAAVGPAGSVVSEVPAVGDMPWGTAVAPRRRRTVVIVSVAVAAVLGAVVLAVNLPAGGDRRAAGDTPVATGVAAAGKPSAASSPSPSSSPSRSSSPSAGANAGAGGHRTPVSASAAPSGAVDTAAPLNVNTRPYVYDDPCSQHFLVDSEPAQVGPPANEQDAPRWAAAYGAVSSGEQEIALTVQGTGDQTVVLEALHVRVLSKGAPLAWNDYSMGVGCGGGVGTKSFDIDLDNGSPTVTVKNGQRDFPYKVSESDPEVFYVFARTKAHDVRWDLTLDWSSGSRHGTVRVDNAGTAFRTSADVGRPGYDYPLGGSEWVARDGG
ncbi:helix-turn-helix domain-containing protein [Streptomyces fuscichromogenes]|uniref:helix-turn-helix domain-containing protein n=1 Tax=Streptomyces fuscichromogenes TaxID=1324013 RepID=UPI003818DAC6